MAPNLKDAQVEKPAAEVARLTGEAPSRGPHPQLPAARGVAPGPRRRLALSAYRRVGRGRHNANLNFGDCLSYAVAHLADEALLFVGDDLAATDVTAA